MNERKGPVETIKLFKALLANYPSQRALSEKSHFSESYICLLKRGRRIASKSFCDWVKAEHPELQPLCAAVRLSKLAD
jgi:hypothetical protein